MKTKTINLYSFDELSKEAQEKARVEYNTSKDQDNYLLTEFLEERLQDLLKENKIKSDNVKIMYSLSYCQGDGVMFSGNFNWGTWKVDIKHSGHYYHSNSKDIEMYQVDDESIYPEQHTLDKFEKIYQSICKELEKYGYDIIETEDSMENFKENCEANDFLFTIDGVKTEL